MDSMVDGIPATPTIHTIPTNTRFSGFVALDKGNHHGFVLYGDTGLQQPWFGISSGLHPHVAKHLSVVRNNVTT